MALDHRDIGTHLVMIIAVSIARLVREGVIDGEVRPERLIGTPMAQLFKRLAEAVAGILPRPHRCMRLHR